jgi:hypothetical protein
MTGFGECKIKSARRYAMLPIARAVRANTYAKNPTVIPGREQSEGKRTSPQALCPGLTRASTMRSRKGKLTKAISAEIHHRLPGQARQ